MPIHHAFIMVGMSFDIPIILFYLAIEANKNKREYDLNSLTAVGGHDRQLMTSFFGA